MLLRQALAFNGTQTQTQGCAVHRADSSRSSQGEGPGHSTPDQPGLGGRPCCEYSPCRLGRGGASWCGHLAASLRLWVEAASCAAGELACMPVRHPSRVSQGPTCLLLCHGRTWRACGSWQRSEALSAQSFARGCGLCWSAVVMLRMQVHQHRPSRRQGPALRVQAGAAQRAGPAMLAAVLQRQQHPCCQPGPAARWVLTTSSGLKACTRTGARWVARLAGVQHSAAGVMPSRQLQHPATAHAPACGQPKMLWLGHCCGMQAPSQHIQALQQPCSGQSSRSLLWSFSAVQAVATCASWCCCCCCAQVRVDVERSLYSFAGFLSDEERAARRQELERLLNAVVVKHEGGG